MRQAEVALSAELTDDDAPRARRDAAVSELRHRCFRARGALESGFGEEASVAYGLTSTPPSQPDKLIVFVENCLNLLAENPRTEEGLFGNTIDTAKIVDKLEAALDELEDALSEVNKETREEHAARAKRDDAVDKWEMTYRGVAQILSGLYLLAGRADLAERVRPTIRGSKGKSEPPEEGDEPAVEEDVVEPVEA